MIDQKRFSLINPFEKPPNNHRLCVSAFFRQNLILIGDRYEESGKISLLKYNFIQEGNLNFFFNY